MYACINLWPHTYVTHSHTYVTHLCLIHMATHKRALIASGPVDLCQTTEGPAALDMCLAVCCSAFDEPQLKGLMVQSVEHGLTQKGFVSQWAYLTVANPRKALEHLMYLGLPMDPAFMQRQFSISKTRQQERRRGKDFQGRALFQVCHGVLQLYNSQLHPECTCEHCPA